MANEAQLRAVAERYGRATNDYTTASTNVIENVLMNHCNEGVELMRKRIRAKARTRGASTLAQAIHIMPAKISPVSISVATVSDVDYWDFVDKGVKGLKKDKAPNSKYRFRNLGTPPKMISSFKQYIARTGTKTFNKTKLIRKDKRKQQTLIDAAAKQMAVYTKIGGIKPMNYVAQASNKKRNYQLMQDLKVALGRTILINIKRK